jgi:hypothetical protein
LETEEVVHFVLGSVGRVVVCCVRSDGAFEQRVSGLHCVQDVGREVEIADSRCGLCPSLGCGCWNGEDSRSREDGSLRRRRRTDRGCFSSVTHIEAERIPEVGVERIVGQEEWWVHGVLGQTTIAARSNAERRGLTEINPNAIEGGVVPPGDDFVGPPFLGGGQQPIRPHGKSRPIVAVVEVSGGWVSYECLEASALIMVRKNKSAKRVKRRLCSSTHTLPRRICIAFIVWVRDIYIRVDDWYIVLVVAMEASDPGLELGYWICDLVVREIAVQVIDVQVVPVAGQQDARAMDGLMKGL